MLATPTFWPVQHAALHYCQLAAAAAELLRKMHPAWPLRVVPEDCRPSQGTAASKLSYPYELQCLRLQVRLSPAGLHCLTL